MLHYIGPAGLVLGVVVIAIGIAFQVAGASAVVFWSVMGAGIVLALACGIIWLFQELHRGTPAARAS
ncbi:MAG TPA: hypothetical protein VKU84_03755 [Stellaceae bacterium]|nr:hypothetical protein [Stellaceae bacterium]